MDVIEDYQSNITMSSMQLGMSNECKAAYNKYNLLSHQRGEPQA